MDYKKFDKVAYLRFKKRYQTANDKKEKTFGFANEVYVTDFAKYALELLDAKFDAKKKNDIR